MVAIPAAVFSHYLEGRLQNLFHEVDELVFSLAPQIERFEGRMRFTSADEEGQDDDDDGATVKQE
jgi:biopolymer transport protein ExbB